MDVSISRRKFATLAAGIIGGLGIPGTPETPSRAADSRPDPAPPLDDSYLEKGLTGMARAKGWFDAHWGAGVIAGYYLCRDNALDARVMSAIREQLDAVIQVRGDQFALLPAQEPDPVLIEEVPKALPQAIQGGLRAHGHAVIFGSMSIRALRDVPHMALPGVVRSLCGLSQQISKISPREPADSDAFYESTQAMVEATFDRISDFRGLLGLPSIRRPNFTHMVTHTEALMNLEMMGYRQLARSGHAGHQAHLGAPVPEVTPAHDRATVQATLATVMNRDYWTDRTNRQQWSHTWDEKENRNGDWVAAGHLFKVLYSYHRLIQRIDDRKKIQLCSRILLERYLNPQVQGG